MEDHQGILIGYEVADRQHTFMMLLAPLGQLALVQQQLELVLHTFIAASKPEQPFLAISQLDVWQLNGRVKNGSCAHRV
jgi:hypothetical protein